MPPPPTKGEYIGGGELEEGLRSPANTSLFSSKAVINYKDTGSLFLCRSNMGAKRSRSVGS